MYSVQAHEEELRGGGILLGPCRTLVCHTALSGVSHSVQIPTLPEEDSLSARDEISSESLLSYKGLIVFGISLI